MNWQQYSKRRGRMSLQDFLSGCSSKQEAIELFKFRKMDPPLDLLDEFYSNPPVVEDPVIQDEPQLNVEVTSSTTKKTKVSSGTTNN